MPGEQIRRSECGQNQECLQHLGQETEPDRHTRGDQPPPAGVLFAGTLGAVRGDDQQQHQQCVRVVEPEHQRRHRRQREHRAGQQCRATGR